MNLIYNYSLSVYIIISLVEYLSMIFCRCFFGGPEKKTLHPEQYLLFHKHLITCKSSYDFYLHLFFWLK